MNMSKIASIANVSVSTVSKALSDSDEISVKTKKKIIDIAKANNCFDKYYKPKYNKKVIAVICPEILGVHYGTMVTDMEKEIDLNGDTTIVSVGNFSAGKQNELINYYTKYLHPDGIIVVEPKAPIKNSTDVPIVRISFENDTKDIHCIKLDIYPALNEAVKYLKRHGHKKIGFIGEKFTTDEYTAYKDAMTKNQLPFSEKHICISNMRFFDAGYYAIEKMLERNEMPTAFFAAYSHIAIGAIQRIKESGLKIPEDISIISMDDINVIPYTSTKMSCIKMHLDEVSKIAVDLIYQKINRGYIQAEQAISVIRTFEVGETVGYNHN